MNKFRVLLIVACVWQVPVAYGQDAHEGIQPLTVLEKPIHVTLHVGNR